MMKLTCIPDFVETYCQEVLGKSCRQAFEDNFRNYKSKMWEAAREYLLTKIELQNLKEKTRETAEEETTNV